MKSKAVVLLLIVCIVSSNFSRFFIYAGFELNQKYIAATLCENKDKPWLHCNGKCYFMKKIKQAEEREKTNERQDKKNLTQESFFEGGAKIKFHSHLLRLISTPYHEPVTPLLVRPVFQPPQLA